MSFMAKILAPDYGHYDGVRPINIYALRLIYFLMLVFVGTDSWMGLIRHQGPWDPVRAVAVCVWAAYSTLSILGLIHPLRMLPIMVFMIFYKSLWLIVVAYPMWRAGTLAGTPAGEMTRVFLWIPLPIIAVPWKYFFRNYVMWSKTESFEERPVR
jgi:hypothetical protein